IRQPTRWWMHSASERKSCMADASIQIEVVYASVQRQVLKTVDVPVGSSVRQALALSGMDKEFPELDLSQCAVGIFGKVRGDARVDELDLARLAFKSR
ncbi:protein rnfH, partial [Pseudomonas syringae pv. japonica str. M301072]